MQFLVLVGVFSVIVFLYIITYAVNKKVKPPLDIKVEGCKGCNVVGCSNHPAHTDIEEEK